MLTSDEVRWRIARRIRELARAKQVPLTHLADRAGVSRGHLWNVLRGTKQPTIGWLVKIGNALDVDVADLLARPAKRTGGGH